MQLSLAAAGQVGTLRAFEPAPEPMRHRRSTVRGVLAILVAVLLVGPAMASPYTSAPRSPIVFPVVGPYRYTNDFGDPRQQGRHEGNDILAPKKSPVVAVEDGRIKFWTTSSRAGCMLYLYGASGTTYLYVHLNNDVTMANDNRGKCVAGGSYWPGLKDGAKVVAGQAVGFVGDSGDADGTPHLHFEVHPHDGAAANPFPYLNTATRILFTASPGSAVTLSLKGSILAAGEASLTMKVQTATVFPSGLKLLGLRKPMTLTVTPTALVDVPGSPAGGVVGRGASLVGKSAIVLTLPAKTTLETQAAKDGAFSAARVVLAAA
jgi:Peptidase family M23